jgi:hypothetical protein
LYGQSLNTFNSLSSRSLVVIRNRVSQLVIPCQNNKPKSVRADYIYHKNEKGKPSKKGFALFKNDIITFELAFRVQINSRYNNPYSLIYLSINL